jgi:hypothetical protein
MVVDEPRVRRRGFFLHSSDGSETDTSQGIEIENPEGVTVRVRVGRPSVSRRTASSGRSRSSVPSENTDPQIRSGSVTGSRQRAHLPR